MEHKSYQAIAKFLPYSPYKLRPIADIIRGKSALYALNWLKIYANKRTIPVAKVVVSALSNARDRKCSVSDSDMLISEIKIDQGPIKKYFIPGAQGRANFQRKRFCHITVVVQPKEKLHKDAYGTKG